MTSVTPVAAVSPVPGKVPELWAAAQALEASFLSEMLKSTGLGMPRDTFGGGAGEAPFTTFLTAEYARSMTERGGIGLAESIYRAIAPDEVQK